MHFTSTPDLRQALHDQLDNLLDHECDNPMCLECGRREEVTADLLEPFREAEPAEWRRRLKALAA